MNNISEEKLNNRIEHHQNRFDEYAAALNRCDELEREGKTADLDFDALFSGMIEAHLRITKLEELKSLLETAQKTDPNCTQISLTDPDARSVTKIVRRGSAKMILSTIQRRMPIAVRRSKN